MNDRELKKKAASGFVYRFAERALAKGISFVVQLLLARLLMPEEYGIIALVTVLITICDVFVTFGFGNALIANKNSDSLDFSTCFYFCIALALFLYAGVFFSAPAIAAFYENELLTTVLRVMALRIPMAAVNTVQHAYVSKHLRFKKFFYATLIGTGISGVVAVIMAYFGCGVWALVEQYVGNALIDTVCLWFIVKWRPSRQFSFVRLKAIYSYGWKILIVGLIDTVYSRLRTLMIGKVYTKSDLAYYNRGYSFPSFGMRLIEPTVNSVLFPTLSRCNDDQDKMRHITQRILKISTYIISPVLIGLIVTAEPLVLILLTKKWLPCVIYLQIGCIANLFRCQQFINAAVIKANGESGLLLKLDIIKKIIGLAILLVSIQFGVIWVAWSLVAFYFISMMINIAPNRRILNYGYKSQFWDVAKNILPAVIMGACVYPISFLKLPVYFELILQMVAGVAVYIGLSVITKNDSFYYLLKYLKSLHHKRKRHDVESSESEI